MLVMTFNPDSVSFFSFLFDRMDAFNADCDPAKKKMVDVFKLIALNLTPRDVIWVEFPKTK